MCTKHPKPVTFVKFFEHVQGTGAMAICQEILRVLVAEYKDEDVDLRPSEPSRGSVEAPERATGRRSGGE